MSLYKYGHTVPLGEEHRMAFTEENVRALPNGLGVYVLWDVSRKPLVVWWGLLRDDLLTILRVGGSDCMNKEGVLEFVARRNDVPEPLVAVLTRELKPRCPGPWRKDE